jgi:UPF0755 protein
MNRRIVTAAIGATLLLVAAVGWFAFDALRMLRAPGPHAATVRVHVQPGQSLRATLSQVQQAGALRDARALELWLRLRGEAPNVKAGDYDLPAGASALAVLEQLSAGRVVLQALTVVEGATFADFRRALEKHPRVRNTLRGRSDAEIMTALGQPGAHPEGRFFPDTFRFADGTTDLEILQLALRQMRTLLSESWQARAPDLPLRSPDEALVLASIVEKESALASERPRIAGVYVSRLRRGMRLQSDPTVIYGLGSSYDGDIRSRDLTRDTPYNTYTRGGLPPTPIALPGAEAVRAATRPQITGDLFFVATGEPDGSHFFSVDYDAHRAAVQRMLARQRERGLIGGRAGSASVAGQAGSAAP